MAIAGTTEHVFADADAQTEALADGIAGRLADGGAVVLTGGSTPGPLYDALKARDLPWSRVQVTLSDERWVPTDHADSNERLVRERLLNGPAKAARLISLKTPDTTPQDAAAAVEAAIAAMPRPFACVLLGVGEDGHVASLFPCDASAEALDPDGPRLTAPARSPAGAPRLSLTLRALLDAELIVLLVRGEAKRAVLADALGGRAPHLPVSVLLAQARCPVEIYWAP